MFPLFRSVQRLVKDEPAATLVPSKGALSLTKVAPSAASAVDGLPRSAATLSRAARAKGIGRGAALHCSPEEESIKHPQRCDDFVMISLSVGHYCFSTYKRINLFGFNAGFSQG